MVTQLAAANCYKKEHLDRPDIWAKIEHAQFYFSTGYFLTVSPPSVQQIAKHAADKNKVLKNAGMLKSAGVLKNARQAGTAPDGGIALRGACCRQTH